MLGLRVGTRGAIRVLAVCTLSSANYFVECKEQSFRDVRFGDMRGSNGLDATRIIRREHPGHGNVHEQKIGPQRFGFCDGILAVDRFSAYQQIHASGKHGANASPDRFVVIDNQDAQQTH